MKTNSSKKTLNNDSARQAADYVARLYSGAMSEAEEEAFNIWLAAVPEHRSEYEKMLDVWTGLDALAGDPELSASKHNRSRWRHWMLAASILIGVSLVIFQVDKQSAFFARQDITTYKTKIGEQKTITLADSSRITLNTNSSIRIDYSGTVRRAVLEQGEVFFDVARNRARPFTVEMGTQTITVLGTRFNVYKKGAEFTVAVVEGVVAVHQNGQPLKVTQVIPHGEKKQASPITGTDDQYRLEAGAVMTFEEKARVISTTTLDDADRYHEWQSGIVTFDDERLSVVVQEINRYTDRKIMIAEADIMDMRVSGVFHLREVDQVLIGLEQAFPLDIRFNDEGVIIRKKPVNTR